MMILQDLKKNECFDFCKIMTNNLVKFLLKLAKKYQKFFFIRLTYDFLTGLI